MATLHIIYDPLDPPLVAATMPPSVKIARLPIPDNLEAVDVYEIARRLAELLLEQMR